MQKIAPFIWIKENGKEALDFYTGLFEDSKVATVVPLLETPGPEGQFVAMFELMGQPFMMLQGGENEMLKAAGPVSLLVPCDTQEEIDRLWDAFSDGGKPIACGWITDKFGVTWQVAPAKMDEYMTGDPESVKRFMQAMMSMTKFDIAALEAAKRGA